MRTFCILLCCQLAWLAPLPSPAAEATATAPTAAKPAAAGAVGVLDVDPRGSLSLITTNDQVLRDVLAKLPQKLDFDANDTVIARLVAEMLARSHYTRQPLVDTTSSKFLDRYLETLDSMHLNFIQPDLDEFEQYRTKLDEATLKGDTAPARVIFKRLLERLQQRVSYVEELIKTEKFTFDGNDRYNLNRKDAPRPKSLVEAKQLWRQHLRYEILQEKLAKEKSEQIATKITRRYARLLRTFKEFDGQDVFEIYLSALTHVYDPHSDYMGKSSLDNFNVGMSLSLFGIGALLQSEDGYCKIKELKPGPAMRSGQLKENDRIIAVAQGPSEPVDVVDMKLGKVVELIRGKKDTEVRLTVIPADAADPSVRKVVSLIRDEIKLEDQEAKAKIIDVPADGDKTARLGIIDLPSFYADFKRKDGGKSTTVDVRKLLKKLTDEKVEGVILDLRRNGGGSLEEAINLTGLFIKSGPVVQVRDPDGRTMVDEDEDESVAYAGPLVVLTSRFSASASEILAGALQDYGRALVVGDSSTHGKGTVQSLIDLAPYIPRRLALSTNPPGAVKLTIRKFYRASGSSTQLKGVVPDLVLPSVNNYAEVGEGALDNPMPWDTIKGAEFEKLNLIQPVLAELKARSEKRVASDKDYDYVRENIEQFKKNLADKTVSLNEAQRLRERDEIEARRKARLAELKARKDPEEKVYDITLRLADQRGLPPATVKTNTVAKLTGEAPGTKPADKPADSAEAGGDDDEESGDAKFLAVDVSLKEARRILLDLIALWPSQSAVAKN